MSLSEVMDMIGKDGRFQVFVMFALLSTHIPQFWSNAIMSYASYEPDWCCVYDAAHPRPAYDNSSSSCIDLSLAHQYQHQKQRGDGDDYYNSINNNNNNNDNDHFSYSSSARSSSSSSSSSSPSSVFKGRCWNDDDYDDNNCDLKDMLNCHTKKYIDDTQAKTAVTEWNLTCDRHWLAKLITTIQMLGLLTGALVSGVLSDVWGRKAVYIASCVMCAIFNVLAALADSWEMFAGFKFFIGISMGVYLVINMPYLFEFLSDKWRLVAACTPTGVTGLTVFPLVIWAIHDWPWIHVTTSIFMAVLTLPAFWVPESIRWLTAKGHIHEAVAEARTIAKFNGKIDEFDPPRVHHLIQEAFEASQREKELVASREKQYSYLDLYRDKEIAWLTIRLQIMWFSATVITQGVLFDVEALDGNFYFNMFLTSVFDAPVALSTYFFVNRVGRRMTTCVLLALATLVSIVGLISKVTEVSGHSKVEAYTSIAMKALWTGVSVYNMVVTNEVYPTQLRSYGMGMTQLATLVGGTMAAFAVDLDKAATRSFIIMMTLTIIAFFIILFTNECNTSTMADTETLIQSGLYPTPTGSLYQSIERYPIPHQYYRPNHNDNNDDNDDNGDDTSYTSFSSLIKDKPKSNNTKQPSVVSHTTAPPQPWTDQNQARPPISQPSNSELVSPDVNRNYGAVSTSPPKN